MAEPDLRSDETKYHDARVARARADERERCAKIAEAHDKDPWARQIWQGVEIAALIRSTVVSR